MELLDFLAMRWKLFAILLVLGLAVIATVGGQLGGPRYVAQTQVLVRPSASAAPLYAGAPDRYVTTQLTVLTFPDFLDKLAKEVGLSVDQLTAALSDSHDPGTEVVTLIVRLDDPSKAVRTANQVAADLVTAIDADTTAPLQAQAKQLATTSAKVSAQLRRTTAGSPQESVLAAQLSAIGQSQASVQQNLDQGNPSRILRQANSVTSTRWNNLEFVTAVVGFLALLLVLLAVMFTLSKRVLSASRWSGATTASALRAPIQLRGLLKPERELAERRLRLALASFDPAAGSPSITYLPHRTARLDRIGAPAGDVVADVAKAQHQEVVEHDSLGEVARADGDLGSSTAPIVMMVDLSACEFADLAGLSGLDEHILRRVVPVLV